MSDTYSGKQQKDDYGTNPGKSSTRKASKIRVITNEDILRSARRIDCFLSLLNENEVSLLESKSAETVQVSSTLWTREKLIDMIYQKLTQVPIVIEHNGETLEIPKYTEQVIDLAPKLAVYKPTTELTINLSDLDKEILQRLHNLDGKERMDVLQRAGEKLFKTFFPHYYALVADVVKIMVKK